MLPPENGTLAGWCLLGLALLLGLLAYALPKEKGPEGPWRE